jgi:two-component system chemotaxis response regulator CheB
MEMPEMDGIATLIELRKTYPRLPVIMFSTLTQRGAESTFDALAKGANDYVTKPANVGSVTAALQNVRNQLIPKIKGFCPWSQLAPSPKPALRTAAVPRLPAVPRPAGRVDIVAIGVSTGGPNALSSLLSRLPAALPVPVVLVQHMPPLFTRHLANRLNQISSLEVQEAAAGDILRPGGVWIAPGDFHLVVQRHAAEAKLQTQQDPPENSCRPAVDVLFRSVAEVYGANVLGVVMTGMGQDGLRGCGVIRDCGGRVLIQDEASSVVWGMPGAVAQAGLADRVAPLERLADEIVRETQVGRNTRLLANAGK